MFEPEGIWTTGRPFTAIQFTRLKIWEIFGSFGDSGGEFLEIGFKSEDVDVLLTVCDRLTSSPNLFSSFESKIISLRLLWCLPSLSTL